MWDFHHPTRLTAICNESRQTISVSDGLELLQIITELNIELCASEDAKSPREMNYEISHWLERKTNL